MISEPSKPARGRLKVFFGAAAGVGKTYAMLEEGRTRALEGLDVVVGYVEPHARPETEAMLLGMAIIPARLADGRRELDLDAVLTRKPQLALIDELAHANAPGLRHARRWHDVAELLAAEINVYTTVNVQNLESINDIIERITGVKVRETLPDSVLEEADEVELIDTSPDELLARLAEGKIFGAEQIGPARLQFFAKENLTALRELALRRTAERVDAQIQDLRARQGAGQPWAATERILVCIGPSPTSARLVRAAKRLAAGLRAPWITAYVETPAGANLPPADRDRVTQTLQLGEQLGAEAVTLNGSSVCEELLAYARARNVTKIVIGKPDRSRWRDVLRGSLVDEVIRHSGEIDIYAIRGEEAEAAARPEMALPKRHRTLIGYAAAIAVVTGTTLLAAAMYRLLRYDTHSDLSNLVMVYLLATVLVAIRLGRGPAILASFLSVATFDFFFVPPIYRFEVSDSQYLITFAVMLAVALIISTLADQVRSQASLARRRERRTAALLALSRRLAATNDTAAIAAAAVIEVADIFDARTALLTPEADRSTAESGRLVVRARRGDDFLADAVEMNAAHWCFSRQQLTGAGTSTLSSAAGMYLPLAASRGVVGVLGVRQSEHRRLEDPEQVRLLEAFVSQIAAALERANLVDEARAAWERVETEFLRNTLLSSVSHDLRTPLAAISGASEILLRNNELQAREPQSGALLDNPTRSDLAKTILDESQRMERIIANLLDMTRLESGGLQLRKEWQPLAEVVGSALHQTEDRLAGRPITVQLPQDLPMVNIDAVSMEQVLVNLLDNAIEYTPPLSPLDLSARAEPGKVVVEIADRGPGIPPGKEQKVFQKFFRFHSTGGRRGIGLGLAICRGIVEAHGGTIAATNRPGGGAAFRIELPVEGAPPMVESVA